MALPTFPNVQLNTFQEFSMIGGTYKELYFNLFTSSGNPIDVSTQDIYWTLSPYDGQDYISFSKLGMGEYGYFTVYLYSDDTKYLGGKFIQRATLINGNGFDYGLGQGIINIIPAITNGISTTSAYF